MRNRRRVNIDRKSWDIAAGIVLVKEAGGFVSEIDGGNVLQTGSIVAGNDAIHPKLSEALGKAKALSKA